MPETPWPLDVKAAYHRRKAVEWISESEWMSMAKPADQQRRQRSRRDTLVSLFFGVLAVVLLASAAWIYIRDREETFSPAPEPNIPGANEMINVYNVLTESDLEVAYGTDAARIDGVTQPGQELIVDGVPVWAFVFIGQEESAGVAQRATVAASLDPSSLTLTSPSGQPINAGDVNVISQSNVLVVVSGEASPELRERIEQAVERLS